jgi:hypothetical protein
VHSPFVVNQWEKFAWIAIENAIGIAAIHCQNAKSRQLSSAQEPGH